MLDRERIRPDARSTCAHETGAAIGKPGRARGEKVPIAVLPLPLRKMVDEDPALASRRRRDDCVPVGVRCGHPLRETLAVDAGRIMRDAAIDRSHHMQPIAARHFGPAIQSFVPAGAAAA
jgi:hypothetical protein